MKSPLEADITFNFSCYRHPFRQPLKTHHGLWQVREGIIVSLRNQQGKIGWGEIAPLAWFGSETLAEAIAFCHSLKSPISAEAIYSIPDTLPSCQFGFESAWEMLVSDSDPHKTKSPIRFSYLLPSGASALTAIEAYDSAEVFKWKIGIDSSAIEMTLLERLLPKLPTGSQLRLDANGGLTVSTARSWLRLCDRLPIIEFLEQPLPTAQFSQMLNLSGLFHTPIALDESVATVSQLASCFHRGWPGFFVIKPAIAGSPRRLRQFCRKHRPNIIVSSVFETKVGREAALNLAQDIAPAQLAVGFGIEHWL